MPKKKVQQRETNRIRIAYIYSLLFLSVLTFIAVYVVTDAIFQQRVDSSIINQSGRQRMLSQRIVKNISFIIHSEFHSPLDSLKTFDELNKAVILFETTHNQLKSQNIKDADVKNSESVNLLFLKIQPNFDAISSSVAAITNIDEPLSYQSLQNTYATLRLHSDAFLQIMENIVNEYVADSEQKQMIAIYKTCALGAIFLITFIFMSVFVFKPAVVSLEKAMRKAKEFNEEIAAAEEELRQQNEALLETQKEVEQRRNEIRNALSFQKSIFDNAGMMIISTDTNGVINAFNATAESILGYEADELIGKQTMEMLIGLEEIKKQTAMIGAERGLRVKTSFELFANSVQKNGKIEQEWVFKTKEGRVIPVFVSMTTIKDSEQQIVGYLGIGTDIAERKKSEAIIQQQTQDLVRYVESLNQLNTQLISEKEKFNHLYNELRSSINYAKRIQSAVLPEISTVSWFLNDFFLVFKPKDVVSGDFYWFSQRKDKIIIIAADCTGHGVPGAFMSMIGSNLLNKIVNTFGVSSPEFILYELHREIRNSLKQEHTDNRDGMDIGVCVINLEDRVLEFAGANRPLYYIQNEELQIFKGDRKSIGGSQAEAERIFTKYSIDITIPTTFYLFSDGYVDQFGGESDSKFMTKRFKEILLSSHHLPMSQQKGILESNFEEWKGKGIQIDDVMIIGGKV